MTYTDWYNRFDTLQKQLGKKQQHEKKKNNQTTQIN